MDTLNAFKVQGSRFKVVLTGTQQTRKWLTLNVGLWTLNFAILACQPKEVAPLNINRVWRAQTVKEGTAVVYTQDGPANVKPGYVNFRLDLTDPKVVKLIDIDNRTLTGTWSVSPDNKRLILDNLKPQPTNTIGTIEYYIVDTPTASTLPLQRTAESRKTGNTINEYQLVPVD